MLSEPVHRLRGLVGLTASSPGADSAVLSTDRRIRGDGGGSRRQALPMTTTDGSRTNALHTPAPGPSAAYPAALPPLTRTQTLRNRAGLTLAYSAATGGLFALGWLNALWQPDVMPLLMLGAIGLAIPLLMVVVFAFVIMTADPGVRDRTTAWMTAIALLLQLPIAAVLIMMTGTR